MSLKLVSDIAPTMSDQEIWKPVEEFDGRYEVSNLGRVRNLSTAQFIRKKPLYLAKCLSNWGYPRVNLYENDKKHFRLVGRLVLEAFVGPCPEGMQAAHLDGKRDNSNLNNLQWVTPKENHEHKRGHGTWPAGIKNGRAKLNEELIERIIELYSAGMSVSQIARNLGIKIGRTAVSDILLGKSWRHLAKR